MFFNLGTRSTDLIPCSTFAHFVLNSPPFSNLGPSGMARIGPNIVGGGGGRQPPRAPEREWLTNGRGVAAPPRSRTVPTTEPEPPRQETSATQPEPRKSKNHQQPRASCCEGRTRKSACMRASSASFRLLLSWFLGFLVSWFLGFLVSWFLGFLISWHLGFLVCVFLSVFLSLFLRSVFLSVFLSCSLLFSLVLSFLLCFLCARGCLCVCGVRVSLCLCISVSPCLCCVVPRDRAQVENIDFAACQEPHIWLFGYDHVYYLFLSVGHECLQLETCCRISFLLEPVFLGCLASSSTRYGVAARLSPFGRHRTEATRKLVKTLVAPNLIVASGMSATAVSLCATKTGHVPGMFLCVLLEQPLFSPCRALCNLDTLTRPPRACAFGLGASSLAANADPLGSCSRLLHRNCARSRHATRIRHRCKAWCQRARPTSADCGARLKWARVPA